MKTRLNSLSVLVRHPARSLVWVLVLGLLGLGGYCTARFLRLQYHRAAAERAADHYDFEEATRHLAICLQLQPRNASLHFQMARNTRRANHLQLAEEHLRRCQQLEGRNPENALETLLLRAQGGDIVEAEKLLLEQVSLSSPDTDLILEALAKGYNLIYHLDASMGCLNHLLERQPDNVEALLLRGSLRMTAGYYTGALEDYRRAVEAQPNHRAARYRFADALLRIDQPEKALRQFEYLHQQPQDDAADVLLGLARSHRQLGHTETARQLLDDLLADNPHHCYALLERGKIALAFESPATAERLFRQAVADYPYDPQSNYLLAQALRKQNREAEARDYEAARNRLKDDLKSLHEAFKRVLKDPTAAEPRLEAGLICLRNGRADEGERWLLSALEQVPDHAATRAALAEHYQRCGKTDLAELYRRPYKRASEPRPSESGKPTP
jgi:predicted Zn-dependent protease